jgi:transglutaminase-like putative cysteine protease
LHPGNAFELRTFSVVIKEAGLGAGGQLPLPTEPESITDFNGPLYYDPVSNTARAPSIRVGGTYEVIADQLTQSTDQMAQRLRDSRPAPAPREEYLQVPPALRKEVQRRFNIAKEPENRLYDRFAAIVARRNEGAPAQRGVYAAARGLVDMFHNAPAGDGKAWTYSLDFRPKPGDDAIARFLDTGSAAAERFGHCEYFASAMCILMRCYGVPARVCAGFVATNPNSDGVFEVRASAAHAWAEVYFSEWGWLAFDPTPPETSEVGGGETEPDPVDPTAQPDKPPEPDKPDPAQEGGAAEPPKEDWIKSYDREAQQEVFSDLTQFLDRAKEQISQFLSGLTGWMPDVLPRSPIVRTLLLMVPGGLVVLALVWRRRRRKKIEAKVLEQMGEGGKKRQRSLYLQLLLLLAHYGFQKRASETPREFAERVLRKGGNQHVPILALTELYYSLRFGLESSLETDFRHGLAKYSDGLRGSDRAPLSGSSASEAEPQSG